MITRDNLMKDTSDIAWQEKYKQKMGVHAYKAYINSLYAYIEKMPENSELVITNIVKTENEDLFAKSVCRFHLLGCFNLQFSSDFTRLRKFETKSKP